MNRLELVVDENEREKDSPFLGEPPTLPQLVMNILSLVSFPTDSIDPKI